MFPRRDTRVHRGSEVPDRSDRADSGLLSGVDYLERSYSSYCRTDEQRRSPDATKRLDMNRTMMAKGGDVIPGPYLMGKEAEQRQQDLARSRGHLNWRTLFR